MTENVPKRCTYTGYIENKIKLEAITEKYLRSYQSVAKTENDFNKIYRNIFFFFKKQYLLKALKITLGK